MNPYGKIVKFKIDGREVEAHEGQGLVEAARKNGIYIPTLCYFNHIDPPLGTCRVCTIQENGRHTAGCQVKVREGMDIQVNTSELSNIREAIVEMMFSEGNHFCPACEKSGDCALQTIGYEMGIAVSRFPHIFSTIRDTDFKASRLLLDRNRCILCKRCVEDIRTADGKRVFYFQNRGKDTVIGIDYDKEALLNENQIMMAVNCCPTGSILRKGKSVSKPFGDRKYDKHRISEDIPGREASFEKAKPKKKVLATTSLAGCFGCHMSMLDIDLEILDIIEHVDLRKSPLTDIKEFDMRADIGLIEGGLCNSENIEVLKKFRENCDILVSVGECAIWGGLPAKRNMIPLKECLEEAYINDLSTDEESRNIIPGSEDLPKLLDKVYPCHEIVKIDHFIPGCPPSANHIWKMVKNILFEEQFSVAYEEFKYD